MNRGSARRNIFEDESDVAMFSSCLADATAATEVIIESYCFMDNHFHLGVYCPEGRLSEMMQHLSANYTRWFNVAHGIDGSLFRGRFRSVLVQNELYLTTFTRYIHRNPADIGRDPASYPHSSLQAYTGQRRCQPWLDPSYPLLLSGGSAGYETFVLGDRPLDKELARSGAEWRPDELQRIWQSDGCPSVRKIASTVRSMVPHGQSEKGADDVTLLLACELTGRSSNDLHASLGFATAGSLRTALRRARIRMSDDAGLAALRQASLAVLAAPAVGETAGV